MNPAKDNSALQMMVAEIWPILRRSVTPISVIQGNRTIQWGTGTLFRIADTSFLVTACHVWEEAVRHGCQEELHIFNVEHAPEKNVRAQAVRLKGILHRAKDPADVAVFELDNETEAAMESSHFLRLDEVALRPTSPGWCWLFGFPLEWLEEVVDQDHYRFNDLFLLLPLVRGTGALEGYDPRYHFLLESKRDKLEKSDGSPADLPWRLNGISGCSIWQVMRSNATGNEWQCSRPKIVGLQTSYYRAPSLIKVTAWAAVAHVLWQRWPRLRPSIEFHLGPPRQPVLTAPSNGLNHEALIAAGPIPSSVIAICDLTPLR